MAALLFNTCCCCIDLRTASLVIGYLQLTSCILVEILSMIMLAIDYKFEYYPIGKLDPKVTLVVLLLVIILDMGVIIMMIIGVHKVVSSNSKGVIKSTKFNRMKITEWDGNKVFDAESPVDG
ncbi:hypothetical protein EVAR_95575_1 [Eumeta japonica]|uniref:Uncharacterized protein n=1 Tax=Eumeta variegata TaxID=151549 RepID=A0A4C1ZPW1_EUMVA|nr:hypothetical protein EVAR_95575_1 [Eumeta japonica]